MWYTISLESHELFKSVLSQLNRAGVLAAEAPALTLAGAAIPNAIAFPEEDVPCALKVLGLDNPPSTTTDDSRFRLLLDNPVTTLLPPGEDAVAVRATLLPFAEELGTRIVVTNAQGVCLPACNDTGVLRIHIHSAPAVPAGAQQQSAYTCIPSAFGLTLPTGCSDGLTPSGLGRPIKTPEEGVTVAEALGGTLCVLCDLTHPTGSGEIIRELLSRIMERYLDLHSPQIADDPQAAYVQACGRRARLRRALLDAKVHELTAEMGRLSNLLVERARERERVQDELEGLQRRGASLADFEQEYAGLSAMPHVERVEVRSGHLVVHTNEIFIQRWGQTFALGPYELRIPFDGGRVFIHSKRPKFYGDSRAVYAHPHIWGVEDGNFICYGTIAADVPKLLAAREYTVVADLLVKFLHEINDQEERARNILRELWQPLNEAKPCICEKINERREAHENPIQPGSQEEDGSLCQT
jgi:hypothetical protein